MNNQINKFGLCINSSLYGLVKSEILPGTGVTENRFWEGLHSIVVELGAKNQHLLEHRNILQGKLNEWHKANPGRVDYQIYRTFLKETGYLLQQGEDFKITTKNIDDEVAVIAGPQLVVPVDNARYAINAVNARWNSLYNALYGSDVIPEGEGCRKTAHYNPIRGMKIIQYVRNFLDQTVPLATGSHSWVVKYLIRLDRLIAVMGDGSETELGLRECFAGYKGTPDSPTNILLKHNGLHIDICIGVENPIGKGDLARIHDVQIESALTTIMDCEDAVAAVDAEDKIRIYRNWVGLMRGDLTAAVNKGGKTIERILAPAREYMDPDGRVFRLHGRGLIFIRHVGTHIYTDAVTCKGKEIPETFLDAMVTVLAAIHDLKNTGTRNSLTGSIYIVKPKMHGPDEVAAAVELFSKVEEVLGLKHNTIKIGIMDEERRTTVNLKECLRAARARVVFINTGFLDRTGDEIHSCMEAGAVIPKNNMQTTPWLLAYEDNNVDIGLATGMPGHGQIGKGMWAAPDFMMGMMEKKIAHPRSGASTAWVPSPTAAVLHAMHYHLVNVASRQKQLADCRHADLQDILTLPLLNYQPDNEELIREVENNAQGILGYVVRWIDQGIGCSKVPDIHDVALMEDRATLRISSQHVSNWLHHGLITKEQVREIFERMAGIVDRQNMTDPDYMPMANNLEQSIAYQTALELVFRGREMPNGYTEFILHSRRREAKAARQSIN